MRMCRFCGAILGDKRDPFCHFCGIVAPHPELAINFYGRRVFWHIILWTVGGYLIGQIGQLLWPDFGSDLFGRMRNIYPSNPLLTWFWNLTDAGKNLLSFTFAFIGFSKDVLDSRKHWATLDMEQKILAFHRINPGAYRLSGNEVARILNLPGLEKKIAKKVDVMKNRKELCYGTDPTDPRPR